MRKFSELVALNKAIAGPDDFVKVFAVSCETVERLTLYHDLLQKWQRAVNLVGPSTRDQVWQRHFADSAQLTALVCEKLGESPAGEPRIWVDLGAGGGFPGLLSAILLADHGDFRLHLVESNSRKCSFLREVARKCGITVDIHASRIEDFCEFAHSEFQSVSVISARALASLPDLFEYSVPLLSSKTVCFYLKGVCVQQELDAARVRFSFRSSLYPSVIDRSGVIVQISNLSVKAR